MSAQLLGPMARVHVALVLLAIGIAVPVTVLVVRALESAAIENERRHRSLAERILDEMEGELSRFLAEEESRPFLDYRFYRERPDPGSAERNVSPLASAPQRPFVIGYFQVDPDGSVHTPRRPRDPQPAIQSGDWQASPQIDELQAKLQEAWTHASPPRPRRAESTAVQQGLVANRISQEALIAGGGGRGAQGTQGAQGAMAQAAAPLAEPEGFGFSAASERGLLAPKGAGLRSSPRSSPRAKPDANPVQQDEAEERKDSYALLRQLNLAQDRRAQRKRKFTQARSSALYDAADVTGASIPDAVASEERDTGLLSSIATSLFTGSGVAASPGSRASAGRAAQAVQAAPALVRIALDPMVGRASGAGALLLYRTVVADAQAYRQGLLIDEAGLGRWLTRAVLEPSGLASAVRASFFQPRDDQPQDHQPQDQAPETSTPTGGENGYRYVHRFAEPFDELAVALVLEPLPGGRGTGSVYALAGLLALVALAGLFAIQRMVSVAIHFAERRARFVAAVSHELKTPLTSIRMYAEMLRDGLVSNDAKRDEYYRTITDESERLSRLIDNVLEFSRLEKGEHEQRASAAALGPVVREIIARLSPHAEREGFALRLECPETLPDVWFDRDALTQVLFNLVENALKYAVAPTRREIVVACSETESAVLLSVRDFGAGVPESQLRRIFEPFYRGVDELTRTTKGTGIGLALVTQLVESGDGRVDAINAPGGGLEIRITLPRAEAN